MLCHEVLRALSAPPGVGDRAALDRHLEGCENCAAWAAQAEQFDRIWEATRPADPSPEAWDALWARVTEAAERPAVPIARPWRRWGLYAASLAQAAAVLIGATTLLHHAGPTNSARAQAPVPLEVEEGQILIIRVDESGRLQGVVRRAQEEPSEAVTVAAEFELLNAMEALE